MCPLLFIFIEFLCGNFAKIVPGLPTPGRRGALSEGDAPLLGYGYMMGCAVYIYACNATVFKASYKLMQLVQWSPKKKKYQQKWAAQIVE